MYLCVYEDKKPLFSTLHNDETHFTETILAFAEIRSVPSCFGKKKVATNIGRYIIYDISRDWEVVFDMIMTKTGYFIA